MIVFLSDGQFFNQPLVTWVFRSSNSSKVFCLIAGLLCASTTVVLGQSAGSHQVAIGIAPISVMSLTGDVPPLVVYRNDNVKKGFVREVTFYNLTTNIPGVTIEATLDSPMPEGTSLWINGESTLGKSAGRSQLDADRRTTVISAIRRGLENGRSISFRFVVEKDAIDFPLQSRNVTISLVDETNGKREEHIKTIFFSVINTDSLESDR